MQRPFAIANAVFASISLLLWGGFTWMGFDGIEGIERQGVPGYPNAGQINYYFRFPLSLAVIALVLYALARLTRFGGLALTLQILLLLTWLPWIFFYTGGV